MSDASAWHYWQAERLMLRIRLQPRASRDEVIGPHGDSLKIRIKSPPVDGAANNQLLKFLTKKLKLRKADIELVSGHSSREKIIAIACREPLPERLAQLLQTGQLP